MTFERALLLLLAALVLALWFALWRLRGRMGRRSRARNRRALAGEGAAETLLEDEGFVILERQARREAWMEIDGEPVAFGVRADLLVERDGLLYVAEVKTGERAPDPRHAATRRQLLEYQRVFEPDGLLLVDAEAGRVLEVLFPD
ncbi:MAG: hypothetical protein H6740_08765 [Alphaproteobacteria bacterium]|nr:hypothetical protein [Alphaproteobacteria bacterium]